MGGPQLELVNQGNLAIKDFEQMSGVYCIVKNNVFNIRLRITGAPLGDSIDYSRVSIECILVYATIEGGVGGYKEVEVIKNSHLSYSQKSEPNPNQSYDDIMLRMRISALSSQHQGMFFRVYMRAVDPTTWKSIDPPLTCVSHPIKVISKPEHIYSHSKKGKAKKRKAKEMDKEGEVTMEVLADMLEDNQSLLQTLADRLNGAPNTARDLLNMRNFNYQRVNVNVNDNERVNGGEEPPRTKQTFADLIRNALLCYAAMDNEDKVMNVRSLLRNLSNEELALLGELTDQLNEEGVNAPRHTLAGSSHILANLGNEMDVFYGSYV